MSNLAKNLIVHAGGERIVRSDLATLLVPEATRTHQPVPHNRLVDLVVGQLEANGVRVKDERHATSHNGARYFGVFDLDVPRIGGDGASASDDYGLIVGLRNSHDRSFQASLALGSRVFVCDNLAFSGDVTIARKHTRHILRDLPNLTHAAVGKIVGERIGIEARIAAYKGREINDRDAHDLLVKALDAKVISAPKLPLVLEQWRNPNHPEFADRTAWSLFNAFTEVLKSYDDTSAFKRGKPLHGVFDSYCVLAA